MMAAIKNIFLHCSDSNWGDAFVIDAWHKRRGWPCIGYHFVILNGLIESKTRWACMDGAIQPGHVLDNDLIMEPNEIGYHVANRNHDSVGICMIGTTTFTDKQFQSAYTLIHELLKKFNLGIDSVLGHYEEPTAHKTCPNIPMAYFRKFLADTISVKEMQQILTAPMTTVTARLPS